MTRAELAGFSHPAPDHGFARAYQLPTGSGGLPTWLRLHTIDQGRSTYKLEGGHVLSDVNGELANLLANQDDFSAADWTKTNTGTVTADNAAGPDGTSDADKIDDNDGTNRFVVSQTETVSDDDGVHFVGVKMKADDASYASLQVKLSGGTTPVTAYVELKFADASLTKGGAQAGQLQSYDREDFGSSWYWLWLAVKNNTTGNTTLAVELYPTGLANDAATVQTAIWAVDAWTENIVPMPVRYVAQVTDPDAMTTDFRELLALRLAVEFAVPIANSGTLRDRTEADFARRIRGLRGTDAIEDAPEAIPVGNWVTARGLGRCPAPTPCRRPSMPANSVRAWRRGSISAKYGSAGSVGRESAALAARWHYAEARHALHCHGQGPDQTATAAAVRVLDDPGPT